MSDYTPDYETVAIRYVIASLCDDDDRPLARAEFNRFIASVKAEALREFRTGLGRRFWFQDPYGHFDPDTVSALHRQVEGMLDDEIAAIENGANDE